MDNILLFYDTDISGFNNFYNLIEEKYKISENKCTFYYVCSDFSTWKNKKHDILETIDKNIFSPIPCKISELAQILEMKDYSFDFYINAYDKEKIEYWKEQYKYAKVKNNIQFYVYSNKKIEKVDWKRNEVYEFLASKQSPFDFMMSEEKIKEILYMVKAQQPILLLGERGTGKTTIVNELIKPFRKIDDKHFIHISCATLDAADSKIIDSQLFGYVKGAFSGADKNTKGLIETAENGILFLDEVHFLPKSTQGKLLQFLQNHTFQRSGSEKTIHIDNVQLIFASNLEITELLRKLQYDFFDRISTYIIETDRIEDQKVNLHEIWNKTWKNYKLFKTHNPDFFPPECPVNFNKIQKTIEKVRLNGNYRDLEKLCAYFDLYLFDELYDTQSEKEKNEKTDKALNKWLYIMTKVNYAQNNSTSAEKISSQISLSKEELKSHTWTQWDELFRKWLYKEAVKQFGNDTKAAEALQTSRSTFQNSIFKD